MSIVKDSDTSFSKSQEDRLFNAIKRFWEIETVGTHEYEEVQAQDDQRPFLENLVYKDGHYEVSLPWLRDTRDVPNHYLLCIDHLKLLHRKLLKKPEVLKEYQQVIDDQLERGIIEVCNP